MSTKAHDREFSTPEDRAKRELEHERTKAITNQQFDKLEDEITKAKEEVFERLNQAIEKNDLEIQDEQSRTPFLLACTTGNLTAVICAVQSGCNIFAKDGRDREAMELAKQRHELISSCVINSHYLDRERKHRYNQYCKDALLVIQYLRYIYQKTEDNSKCFRYKLPPELVERLSRFDYDEIHFRKEASNCSVM